MAVKKWLSKLNKLEVAGKLGGPTVAFALVAIAGLVHIQASRGCILWADGVAFVHFTCTVALFILAKRPRLLTQFLSFAFVGIHLVGVGRRWPKSFHNVRNDVAKALGVCPTLQNL
jgi:hypothetical protein